MVTHHTLRGSARQGRSHRRSNDHYTTHVNDYRTGTVLQFARGLLATTILAVTASPGLPGEAAAAGMVEQNAAYLAPGAIGAPGRLQPGPCPVSNVSRSVQPVEIRGPAGVRVAIETAEGWTPLQESPLRLGLVVGHAYRLRVAGLPGREGEELFPSVRVLARLGAPPGTDWRFPVEIVIDADDLAAACDGALIRRVVYVSCETQEPDLVPAGWFDVKPGDDAFEVASTLGDPVAELIIGNRLPAPGSVP
jgi:hypothetical protein